MIAATAEIGRITRRRRDGGRARCAAFTLVDLMMALAVLAVLVAVVVPTAQPDEQVKLLAGATRLAADIEYAQSASLASPSDPTVVRLADDGQSYWLALKSKPDVPIERPDSDEPFEVVFGDGDARGLEGLLVALTAKDAVMIEFDSFGRLATTEDAVVRLSNEAGSMYVAVACTTGSVKVLGQAPAK